MHFERVIILMLFLTNALTGFALYKVMNSLGEFKKSKIEPSVTVTFDKHIFKDLVKNPMFVTAVNEMIDEKAPDQLGSEIGDPATRSVMNFDSQLKARVVEIISQYDFQSKDESIPHSNARNAITQEVVYSGLDNLPAGSTVSVFGAPLDIPIGWRYCDGINGTPNLLPGHLAMINGLITAEKNAQRSGQFEQSDTSYLVPQYSFLQLCREGNKNMSLPSPKFNHVQRLSMMNKYKDIVEAAMTKNSENIRTASIAFNDEFSKQSKSQ